MTPTPALMPKGAQRAITEAEWSALTPGLAAALRGVGAQPLVVARASMPARAASLFRGAAPIMVLGQRIFWPGALEDFTLAPKGWAMGVLQHELQHVLEFATGELSVLRYAAWPPNWRYGYRLDLESAWRDFGAEQRASIAEHLWLIDNGLMADPNGGGRHRRVIPWAQSSA